jgi:arylsulfatase A-like enzyme
MLLMNKHLQPSTRSRALTGAQLAFAASLLVLFAALGFAATQHADAAKRGKVAEKSAKTRHQTLLPNGERPSFVVIQTDDQTLDSLHATFTPPGGEPIQVMPNTLALLEAKGVSLSRYYVSYPLCCPSRVSLLTGRYAHNHNVRGNVQPNGGFLGYSFRGANNHNIGTWLQGVGYRTIHVGKYLNGYGDEPYSTGAEVPPGWNAWHTTLKADTHHYFYGYRLNNNGVVGGPYGDSGSWDTREYGKRDDFGCPVLALDGQPCLYETDVLNRIAVEEMWGTPAEKPFYLQLDYTAPHGDYRRPAGPEPAPRHYNSFAGARLPHNRSEGVNEGNVNDKPRFIREAPFLSANELRTYRVYYEKQLEALRSIDEGVKQVVDTLGAMGRLRNTYIIFTSDNGFFFGEHRLTGGKFIAYEPATHMPFLMRGPGIKQGSTTGELAMNVDIAPTILELAHASADKSIDGRSLVPYVTDTELRSRRPLLYESFVETNDVEANGAEPSKVARPSTTATWAERDDESSAVGAEGGATASITAPPKDYVGIRYGAYKYIEWPSGEKELYNISKDPNELNNVVRDRNLAPIRNFLHTHLAELAQCSGRSCREVLPELPPNKREQRKLKRQREKEQRERERERERREKERKKKGSK